MKNTRFSLILQVLQGREIILIIDETGDRKKGNKTAYVKRQYIGNVGKVENGIVALTAYGLVDGKVFPIPQLSLGFPRLIALMNQLRGAVPTTASEEHFQFSSA